MNLKEKILPNMKKLLREPLFYLLFLLAIAGIWIIPEEQKIKYVSLIANGKAYSESFPISTRDIRENTDFSISFYIDAKKGKKYIYKLYPDDCILNVIINGNEFPQERINGACDYNNGTELNFSEFLQNGSNKIDIKMRNHGGPGGLRVEKLDESLNELTFMHCIFALFFLISIALILKKFKLKRETIIACFLAFPFVIYAFVLLCLRINYELAGVYTFDTPIYWAVGRGIVNGIPPWSGLWDIKPPGIFLLSAISFKIFDSPIFTHYFQVFVLILTVATPVVAYFLQSSYRSVPKIAFAALAGLLLALYSAERSREVQVESFGAAFACIAALAMAMPNFEKRKILWTTIATIGILGACGFKEPFFFTLFGISLILCYDIKSWLYRFLLPLVIAVLFGIIILLICGWFSDFLHYLDFMSSTHIIRHGSPFQRAMDISRLYNDMNAFSWGLAIALLAILSLPFTLFFANSKANEIKLLLNVMFFGLALFLAAYSVGLGGEYFNHHYIFALPFYMALILFLLKNWTGENSAIAKLGLASFIFLAIAMLNYPNLNLDKRKKEILNNWTKEPVEAAYYLDSKMDELGIDRYVFLGSNGPKIYGWTKHSPDGPYFLQYDIWFRAIPGFGDSIVSSINRNDAVVMAHGWNKIGGNEIAPLVNQILKEHFTKQQVNAYEIYFRKK
jgi:hypothetical protein